MTVDAAILAVVLAFLLPLRLASLVLRLASPGGASAGHIRRSSAALAIAAALLAVIFALPRDRATECAAPIAVADGGGEGGFREEMRSEVEQLKLQLARLESLLDRNSKALDEKGDALEKDGHIIRAMGLDIQSLINGQENMKLQLARLESLWDNNSKAPCEEDGHLMRALELDIQSLINEKENLKESLCQSYSDKSIKAMENEVQILKDQSRKMNSDIYNVWSLANDTVERVEGLHSDIKKVQVMTDEWWKMNSNINRILSFGKDTEKRVETLFSDIKKSFKQTKRKVPFWKDG
ncbi:hypothetical protein ACP70R_015462 [Stipagrostis hirtigluma subsp. patula]